MIPFDYQPRTRIVFGPGKLERLGELAREIGAKRALLVTDRGIRAAGHVDRALNALANAGIDTHVFDDVCENPTSDVVDSGVAVARGWRPDIIIGLGGGSAMDSAKGINFVVSCGGRIHDYWGIGKATAPLLPMIAVPTTAGTGSETQSFALISDAQTHVKMACGDPKASFRVALLDPELTVSQPPLVTALTGIDAIAHALETYVTRVRNPASLAFSREAWLLLGENYSRVLDHPSDLEARGGMQLGACFAGLAIENSMLGAAHALANPLTARYGVAHGQAVSLMLPHVIRFNGEEHGAAYRDLLEGTGWGNDTPAPADGHEGLAEFVSGISHKAGLCSTLAECGIERNRLSELAAEAAKQWTATFNPRPVGEAELLALYQAAYD